MNSQLTYCKGWFRARKVGVDPLTPTQARQAHEAGELYTVLLGDPDRLVCFLEVRLSAGYVGAEFLDDLLRVKLSYQFEEIETGRLFLKTAIYNEYDGSGDSVAKCAVYNFSPHGRVSVGEGRPSEPTMRFSEREIDTTGNWEAVPSFGCYDCLMRSER